MSSPPSWPSPCPPASCRASPRSSAGPQSRPWMLGRPSITCVRTWTDTRRRGRPAFRACALGRVGSAGEREGARLRRGAAAAVGAGGEPEAVVGVLAQDRRVLEARRGRHLLNGEAGDSSRRRACSTRRWLITAAGSRRSPPGTGARRCARSCGRVRRGPWGVSGSASRRCSHSRVGAVERSASTDSGWSMNCARPPSRHGATTHYGAALFATSAPESIATSSTDDEDPDAHVRMRRSGDEERSEAPPRPAATASVGARSPCRSWAGSSTRRTSP